MATSLPREEIERRVKEMHQLYKGKEEEKEEETSKDGC